MSIECGICERDLRGGHAEDCPRNPKNKAIAAAEKAEPEIRSSDDLIEGTVLAKIPRGLILPVDSLPGVRND